MESFHERFQTEEMLKHVGISKGELFINPALINKMESVFHFLQDLFCVQAKLTVNENKTFVLGYWSKTFR